MSTPNSEITLSKKDNVQFYEEGSDSASKPLIASESKSSSSMTSTDEQLYENDENIEVNKKLVIGYKNLNPQL